MTKQIIVSYITQEKNEVGKIKYKSKLIEISGAFYCKNLLQKIEEKDCDVHITGIYDIEQFKK